MKVEDKRFLEIWKEERKKKERNEGKENKEERGNLNGDKGRDRKCKQSGKQGGAAVLLDHLVGGAFWIVPGSCAWGLFGCNANHRFL